MKRYDSTASYGPGMYESDDGEYVLLADVVAMVKKLRNRIIKNAPSDPGHIHAGILAGGTTAVRLILRELNATHDDEVMHEG